MDEWDESWFGVRYKNKYSYIPRSDVSDAVQNKAIYILIRLALPYLLSQKSAVFASMGCKLCPSEYCVIAILPRVRGYCGGEVPQGWNHTTNLVARTQTYFLIKN